MQRGLGALRDRTERVVPEDGGEIVMQGRRRPTRLTDRLPGMLLPRNLLAGLAIAAGSLSLHRRRQRRHRHP